MEEQYLKISEKQSKLLNQKGFKTYKRTSIKPGQEKIIDYVINLSEILSYLENNADLINRIKAQDEKLDNLEKEIEKLKRIIEKKK